VRSRTAAAPFAAAIRAGIVPRLGLYSRLGEAARVTEVSAPAGSGKTILLRSWTRAAGLTRARRLGIGAWRGARSAPVLDLGGRRAPCYSRRIQAGAGADRGARP
jgi:hypothetical protein